MPWRHGVAGVLVISALTGCNRDETRVYHVPKDDSSPSQPAPATTPDTAIPETAAPDAATPGTGAPTPDATTLPQLHYQLPEGWKEKPLSEMRVASFAIPGPDGQAADVSAIPLPIVGRDMELVNLWRSQVQLPPTSDPTAVQQAEPVDIGGEQGRLFEYVSEQPMMGKSRQRILVAMLTRGEMSWFFKMSGEDAFVSSQKAKFIQFLKSISFVETAAAQIPAVSTCPSESAFFIQPGNYANAC